MPVLPPVQDRQRMAGSQQEECHDSSVQNEDNSLWRCTSWSHCSTKYIAGHPEEQLNQKLQRKVGQREREEKRMAEQHQKVHSSSQPNSCSPGPGLACTVSLTVFICDCCFVCEVTSKSQHRATPSADWASYLEQNGFSFSLSPFLPAGVRVRNSLLALFSVSINRLCSTDCRGQKQGRLCS